MCRCVCVAAAKLSGQFGLKADLQIQRRYDEILGPGYVFLLIPLSRVSSANRGSKRLISGQDQIPASTTRRRVSMNLS
jgi:hypothetical protein